jgi:uncharacterized membrane protein required for colicin V production
MNRIDITILIIVLVFSLAGYFRGFLRETFSLLASAGGFLSAVWKTNSLAPFFCRLLPMRDDIVFAGIFALLLFAASALIEIILSFLYNQVKTASKNRIGKWIGCLLGFFKGVVFASLLALMLPVFPSGTQTEKTAKGSLLYKPVRVTAPAILEWTAGWFEPVQSNYQEVKDRFSRLIQKKPSPSSGTDHETDHSR